MISSRPPRRVLVRPHRAAFVVLNHYRCDRGNLRSAKVVAVARAGTSAAGSRSISITDPLRRSSYCGKGDPGSTLVVSPFVSSLEAALKH